MSIEEIRPQHMEVTENGVTYITAQLTEEQVKALKRNFIEDYSVTERIEWKPGQGFVIEDHPEESE